MTTLKLIWAQSLNGVIGADNALPWHIPEDLAHFRNMTRGNTVIMGRKTWDSLPSHARPLPGRKNIVLTRQSQWECPDALVASSLEEALTLAGEEAWIIGGGSLYAQALPLAQEVHITCINEFAEGDTLVPSLDDKQWTQKHSSGWLLSSTGLQYSFNFYVPAIS